jgi:hypothetical protein
METGHSSNNPGSIDVFWIMFAGYFTLAFTPYMWIWWTAVVLLIVAFLAGVL